MCWAAQTKRVPCIRKRGSDTSGEGTTLQLFGNLEVSILNYAQIRDGRARVAGGFWVAGVADGAQRRPGDCCHCTSPPPVCTVRAAGDSESVETICGFPDGPD